MKKLFLIIFPFFVLVSFIGCESMANVKIATFSNITSAGSENYAMRINFQNDSRYQEKYYDIQVMSDTQDLQITFWKENNSKLSTNITEKDIWLSLTSLKVSSAGLEGQETFGQLKDAVTDIYIFNVSKPCKLIFRVVAGQIAENSDKTGFVILNTAPISDDFVLNCF